MIRAWIRVVSIGPLKCNYSPMQLNYVVWGRMTHICVDTLLINATRRHVIIWTNAGILLIGPLRTNSVTFRSKFLHFHSRKRISKRYLRNVRHLFWRQCVKWSHSAFYISNIFVVVLIVSHLNALNMLLYFRLPYFHVSNSALFST